MSKTTTIKELHSLCYGKRWESWECSAFRWEGLGESQKKLTSCLILEVEIQFPVLSNSPLLRFSSNSAFIMDLFFPQWHRGNIKTLVQSFIRLPGIIRFLLSLLQLPPLLPVLCVLVLVFHCVLLLFDLAQLFCVCVFYYYFEHHLFNEHASSPTV